MRGRIQREQRCRHCIQPLLSRKGLWPTTAWTPPIGTPKPSGAEETDDNNANQNANVCEHVLSTGARTDSTVPLTTIAHASLLCEPCTTTAARGDLECRAVVVAHRSQSQQANANVWATKLSNPGELELKTHVDAQEHSATGCHLPSIVRRESCGFRRGLTVRLCTRGHAE